MPIKFNNSPPPSLTMLTKDADAMNEDIILGKTAYAKGVKKTGTMPNNGSVQGTINSKSDAYTIPKGYHNGTGNVQINSSEQEKIIPDNIREGITLLGVEGAMKDGGNIIIGELEGGLYY